MATFNVTQSGDSGEGSLREAIDLANTTPGTDDVFVQTDVELNSEISITESVNIGTPYGATITQTENSRIFYIQDSDTEQKSDINLYRLNLTGGNAFIGGAIISYENLNITDSSLYNNTAVETGAAVYVAGSTLTVRRTEIYDNLITSLTATDARDLFVFNGELDIIDPVSQPVAEEPAVQEPSTQETEARSTIEAIPEATEVQSDGVVVGSVENDTLIGNEAEDTLLGDSGDDLLNGGDGNDILNGGAGEDFLDGGTGDDSLKGGADNDFLQDSQGNNFLFGDRGDDRLIGGQDLDNLYGGEGNDDLDGGNGNDTLNGEDGDDTLYGGAGNDTLLGGAGNDSLDGSIGDDIIYGNDNDDYLTGSGGDDIIHGDSGNDTLSGDRGNNFLVGGDGSDLFDVVVDGNSVIADFDLDSDRLQLSQLSFSDLDITGNSNSYLNYQGSQIAMLMEVNPMDLNADSFVEA